MPTIGGLVIQQAVRVPEREALVMGPLRWTWADLDREVGRVAGSLEACGVEPGDRVAIVAANTPEHVIAYLAIARLAAIVVPVNTRLAPPELLYILVDSGARLVLTGETEADVVDVALAADSTVTARRLDLRGLLEADRGVSIGEDRGDEAGWALIVYTSGTTGRPKGVLHTHHSALWAALAQITSLGMRDGERYLHLPPLYHSGGVVYLNATLLLGGTNVLVPAFDPPSVLEAIEAERITALLGVPTMFQFLLREPSALTRDTSSWRIGVFGAAPMPAATVEKLLTTFPTVRFYQQCGQTEAGPTGLYSTTEQLVERPDSSGHQAQTFVEARVLSEDGDPIPVGGIGELCFRSEAMMAGYWNNPSATAETIRGGWLHTGDLVHVRADGSMKLVDRIKDVIITGGRNVYSAEVEKALAAHPDVLDCAVIGRHHGDWGETVVAVITPRDGASITVETLRSHCAGLIADYKAPREVIFGEIPRNGAGKVQKHLIRDQLRDAIKTTR